MSLLVLQGSLSSAFHLPAPVCLPSAALEVLNLQGGSFLALPAVLPSSLTKLVLASNAALELSVTDAERLLALPHLAELELRGTATPPAVLARLQQAPNLRITS